MNNKFTVIKGNTDTVDTKSIMRILALHDCWQRQYHNAIYKGMSNNKGKQIADYPQEDLMKIALAGIKYINSVREIRRESARVGTDYVQTLEESKATFNLIDAIFTVMGYIKLKNLVITFPITKDFDGHKWESKDYFYTMNVLSKLEWDKPIGRDKIFDFLWDYENNDLRNVCVDCMCAMSAIYCSQTGEGIAEQWLSNKGVPSYTINEDAGIMKNSQTGEIMKIKKGSHIQIVK